VVAPDFRIVLNAGEFGCDLNSIAALHHSPGQQGVDGQLFSDFLDVNLFAFVAENGVTGFHFQLRHVG
jgi:hypothetical protein